MVKMFVESLSHVDSWVTFAFVLISFSVFVNGGGYSDNPIIGGLSLIYLLPIAFLNIVASANALLLPVAVIAFFGFILSLNRVFGDALWILACFAGFAVMLGA